MTLDELTGPFVSANLGTRDVLSVSISYTVQCIFCRFCFSRLYCSGYFAFFPPSWRSAKSKGLLSLTTLVGTYLRRFLYISTTYLQTGPPARKVPPSLAGFGGPSSPPPDTTCQSLPETAKMPASNSDWLCTEYALPLSGASSRYCCRKLGKRNGRRIRGHPPGLAVHQNHSTVEPFAHM